MLREKDRFGSLEEESDKEPQTTVSSSTLDFPKSLTYSHKSRWRSWGSPCFQHALFSYSTKTLLIYIQVTDVIHIIFFGKGGCWRDWVGKEMWARKTEHFSASKTCFFPPHCQIVLFCWLKPDGPSDVWWSNKVHMLKANMKQRC